MRRSLALLLVLVLALGACASHPDGAYYPTPKASATVAFADTLHRAALAAGDDPARYSFALVKTDEVSAFAAEDATFYFSEGLARQPQRVIDALVAQKVAHEVLEHAGKRRTLSLSVTAGFTVLGIAMPGLGLLDFLVNPADRPRLHARSGARRRPARARDPARDGPRSAAADARHRAPRRRRRQRPGQGWPPGDRAHLDDRLARLEPLEPAGEFAARAPAPDVR